MARRERTTGLPRARQRTATTAHPRRSLNERAIQLAMLGAVLALLLAVVGVFAYRLYDSRIARPNSAVLTVGDEKVSLRYYADRLGPWVQANIQSQTSLAVLQENLLTKLEDEALTVIIAREAGVDLSDEALEQFIADGFGVPVGGTGSSYDALYRNELRQLGIDDGDFRRMKRAELADAKLRESIAAEVGTAGTQHTIRLIVTSDEETAAALKARIEGGEDMGTIAQTESIDLESRQNDGLLQPVPLSLLPEAGRDALTDQEEGTLIGPVEVEGNWWVARIEAIEERDYTQAHREALVAERFGTRLDEKRAELLREGDIDRSLDGDDIEWAQEHATFPETAS
jgi:parvulin-like peptidyl-prolyl isomerase